MSKRPKTENGSGPSKSAGLETKKSAGLETKQEKHDLYGLPVAKYPNYPHFRLACLVCPGWQHQQYDIQAGIQKLQELLNEKLRLNKDPHKSRMLDTDVDLPVLCFQPPFFTQLLTNEAVSGCKYPDSTSDEWKKFLTTGDTQQQLAEQLDKWITYRNRPNEASDDFANGWLFVLRGTAGLHVLAIDPAKKQWCRAIQMYLEQKPTTFDFFSAVYNLLFDDAGTYWNELDTVLTPWHAISYESYVRWMSGEEEDELSYLLDLLWFHWTFPTTRPIDQLDLFRIVYRYSTCQWAGSISHWQRIKDRTPDFYAFIRKNEEFMRSMKKQTKDLDFPYVISFQEKKYTLDEKQIAEWYQGFVVFSKDRLLKDHKQLDINSLDHWPSTLLTESQSPATEHIRQHVEELYKIATQSSPFWHDRDVYAIRDKIRMSYVKREEEQPREWKDAASIRQHLVIDEAPDTKLWNKIKADLKDCTDNPRSINFDDLDWIDSKEPPDRRSWPSFSLFLRFMLESKPNRWHPEQITLMDTAQLRDLATPLGWDDYDRVTRFYIEKISERIRAFHPLRRKMNVPYLRESYSNTSKQLPRFPRDPHLQKHLATFLGPFRSQPGYYDCGHANLKFYCTRCENAFYCSKECQRVHYAKGRHACKP
jgi:hypothetical protein